LKRHREHQAGPRLLAICHIFKPGVCPQITQKCVAMNFRTARARAVTERYQPGLRDFWTIYLDRVLGQTGVKKDQSRLFFGVTRPRQAAHPSVAGQAFLSASA
jgi:hypothetical protein